MNITPSITPYWQKVIDTSERLKAKGMEEVWLMSLDSDTKGTHAGAVSVVARDIASRRLVEVTHRIATPDEIAAHKQSEMERLERDRLRELRRDPRRVIITDSANLYGPQAASSGSLLAKAK